MYGPIWIYATVILAVTVSLNIYSYFTRWHPGKVNKQAQALKIQIHNCLCSDDLRGCVHFRFYYAHNFQYHYNFLWERGNPLFENYFDLRVRAVDQCDYFPRL